MTFQWLWALAAALVALDCPRAEATASAAARQDLIEWIRSKGGFFSPKQVERGGPWDTETKTRGMFAADDIDEGEVLLQVPWEAILGAKGATSERMELETAEKLRALQEDDGPLLLAECRAHAHLYEEVLKGEESDFAPHLRYLSLLQTKDDRDSDPQVPVIPALWSEEGRALLEDINDHGNLPPFGLFTPLNHDLYGQCIDDIKNSPLEKKVAGVIVSHEFTDTILTEYGLIVPFFDNYSYRLRSMVEEDWSIRNVKGVVNPGENFQLKAARQIDAGEELFAAYGNFQHDEYTTPSVFRNFGIADTPYPKYFEFDTGELVFGLRVEFEEDGLGEPIAEFEIYNDDEAFDVNNIQEFFTQEINRLQRIRAVSFKYGPATNPNSTMTQTEWDTALQYHRNLVDAMNLGLELIEEEYEGVNECPGGLAPSEDDTCPRWDGFEDLPVDEILDLDLEFDPTNPYGPDENAYAMCNDESSEWQGYVPAGEEEMVESQYQEIRFFYHPESLDMVMRLDGTVQQCSSYRPHYHEFAVHYPARFLESVKRVLFVGGGDSMVLHEVLKYPSLERVVGLELDQYVVRNSFRYFNTQPHFNDKRVEWWFGDGAKSLLMLPKDYFQSFDLVVVDLSETVMSFQVTDKLSIFQTLSLLLKPDGIMLKNGEYYMEKMSNYFDYTLQYFEYDVPFICDQGMVIGSNKIDFFNRTMKDHGVELLVLESQDEINEKFNEYYRFTEYRKNDARAQGHCNDEDIDVTDGGKNAGILMVAEIEAVTSQNLSAPKDAEKQIKQVLEEIGFAYLKSVFLNDFVFFIVTKEGYITVRLFPTKSYVALDIELWANFDLMERARDDIALKVFAADENRLSSFRIVTGGMSGSPFQEKDRAKIGPRMVNNRDCEPPSTPKTKKVPTNVEGDVVEKSLEMVEDGIVVAVLCGDEETPCKWYSRLSVPQVSKYQASKHPFLKKKIKQVIPIYTCLQFLDPSAEFSESSAKSMALCEVELSEKLGKTSDKISFLAVDDSASYIMGKVLISIFSSAWNRKRLFSPNRFAAVVNTSNDKWRRNLLVKIRENIVYKDMSLVDLQINSPVDPLNFSVLSLYNPTFFLNLKTMVDNFNSHHKKGYVSMEVESVYDGLVTPQIGKFKPKIFKHDDYDPTPAKKQLAGQQSLGRQSLLQFEIGKRHGVTRVLPFEILKNALSVAIDSDDRNIHYFAGSESGMGSGSITVACSDDMSSHVIVVWDGNTHIDVNLYSKDENPKLRTRFLDNFKSMLGKTVPLTLTLADTYPRGVGSEHGGVVSFPGHMN